MVLLSHSERNDVNKLNKRGNDHEDRKCEKRVLNSLLAIAEAIVKEEVL
jgi:hypothetical protein